MSDLTPLHIAQQKVLSLCSKLEPKKLKLHNALGTVVAKNIVAREQIPAFDNTAMDGFALIAEDSNQTPAQLKVVSTLGAGDPPPAKKLQRGEAIRIMTGAPLPDGADAIVMVEKTKTQTEQGQEYVLLQDQVSAGNFIRRAGEDVSVDDEILKEGQVLTPPYLGVLASQGIYDVMAYPKCRVGVISSGKELIEGSSPLRPGQIRDSNRHILLSLLEKVGATPLDLGIVDDSPKAIQKIFKEAEKTCDALLTSGGVSMGDFDYIKKILTQDDSNPGYALQVAIKPAKPLAFGRIGDLVVFGLPGNPVSSAISFELFARPGLRQMMGHTNLYRPKVKAVAAKDFSRSPDGKTHFVRAIWEYKNDEYQVLPVKAQGSHQLKALAESNGLAVVEDGSGVVAGELLDLICLD